MATNVEKLVPRAFVWRRIHSLTGLWLVVFLILHLVTNSGAALWIGDDGHMFVRLSNLLESLPYLQVIEIVLLGIPFAIHMILGVKYLFSAKPNSGNRTKGAKPAMRYGRSRAYTWQRISAVILFVGIILHVIHMRFIERPNEVMLNNQTHYLVKVNFDEGLYTLSDRLHVKLYSSETINQMKHSFDQEDEYRTHSPFVVESIWKESLSIPFDPTIANKAANMQKREEARDFLQTLDGFDLKPTQVIASGLSPGKVMLLTVRDAFKSPWMIGLYTIFVIAAVYHAFNGLWTVLITWGFILSFRSQKMMVNVCIWCMLALMFLGLASVWGSYWINLRN